MIHVVKAAHDHHTETYGAFMEPHLAEDAREEIDDTLLFGEVFVQEIPVYSSIEHWREREYPTEAVGPREKR